MVQFSQYFLTKFIVVYSHCLTKVSRFCILCVRFLFILFCLNSFQIPDALFGQEIRTSPFKVSAGTLKRISNFPSAFVNPRNIEVWLPPTYSPKEKYSVLYMHDGQMLFDSAQTWNHQEWAVDETMSSLLDQGVIQQCIVVAIWNINDLRRSEYFPERALQLLPEPLRDSLLANELRGKARAEAYLKFIVSELKPFIDSQFSTISDQQHTFIAGSSMGGLISLYAACRFPHIFSGAACLSTHWPGSTIRWNPQIPQAFQEFFKKNSPNPTTQRIYFDYGTATLDSTYKPLQAQIDSIMITRGFTSKNWQTHEFIGAAHNENAWRKRLAIPLKFLLGRK